MLAPVVSTIIVPCARERAFDTFVNDMATWWPLHQRAMSLFEKKKAVALRVEPRLGGTIVEVSEDGTEYLWGTICTFERPEKLALDFHMGLPPEQASLVELTFHALGETQTQVVLQQSRWEAFGELAEQMRGGYGSSWSIIFEEAYATACERT